MNSPGKMYYQGSYYSTVVALAPFNTDAGPPKTGESAKSAKSGSVGELGECSHDERRHHRVRPLNWRPAGAELGTNSDGDSMGYLAILTLDDRTARSADPTELGADLLTLLAGHDYPAGGLEPLCQGAWDLVLAAHSSDLAAVVVDSAGGRTITLRDAVELRTSTSGWYNVASFGVLAQRTRELLVSPIQLARSTNPHAAVVGVNHLMGASVRSVWSVYLDSMRGPLPEPAALGAWITSELERHTRETPGPWDEALTHVGGLTAGGTVVLVASGNRVCTIGELTEREYALLAARSR